MGRVDCFSIPGLDLWFNSNDHEPPHIHVGRPGNWELKIMILERSYSVKWSNVRVRQATIKAVLDLVEENRVELLKEWEKKVDC